MNLALLSYHRDELTSKIAEIFPADQPEAFLGALCMDV